MSTSVENINSVETVNKTENTAVKWTNPKTGKVRYKGNMPLRELKKLVSEDEFLAEREKRRLKKKEEYKKYAEYSKQYYQENRDKKLEYSKQYRQENRDKITEYGKQYMKQYYQENRAKISEYKKQYNQENRDKISEYKKQYYQENRDDKLEYMKQYYQENRDKISEYKEQYYQENPETFRKAIHRRRSNLNNCLPTASTFLKQFNQSEQVCPITGSNTVDLEHIYPVSKGWLGNNAGNLMWLQSSVNCSKGNKNVFTWLSELTQKDLDYLLREEPTVPTLEQFKARYKAELTKQAELLGMTYHEYKTEYNKKYTEATE